MKSSSGQINPLDLWNRFCVRMQIAANAVPLFESDNSLDVSVHQVGRNERLLLKRSPEMEGVVESHVECLINDWREAREFDGLIYLMFYKGPEDNVIPLYIGKTESQGKESGKLSVNIEDLSPRNRGKFARWGDGYQYHIGDLSAVVLGHAEKYQCKKYKNWANTLFIDYPVSMPKQPRLKFPVFFWAKSWRKDDIGPWEDFGPTNLTFLEYLLIGIASSAFPNEVLNTEGQNRG